MQHQTQQIKQLDIPNNKSNVVNINTKKDFLKQDSEAARDFVAAYEGHIGKIYTNTI